MQLGPQLKAFTRPVLELGKFPNLNPSLKVQIAKGRACLERAHPTARQVKVREGQFITSFP